MKRLVVIALLATGLALTLSGLSKADVTEQVAVSESSDMSTDPNNPFIPYDEDPYPDYDDGGCEWSTPEFCPNQPCSVGCPTTCYTCFEIPAGPNGGPVTYDCDPNSTGGYSFCSAHDGGCSTSGQCGSWQ